MRCPKCNSPSVTQCSTAHNDFYNETYRLKSCDICGHIFYTVEFEAASTKKIKKCFKEFNILYRNGGKNVSRTDEN